MRFLALASDYDGTLAHDGIVDEPTVKSLERFRQSGRKLILVTGRELPDLERTFARLDLFDFVVAENGALLFNPGKREKRLLAPPAPENFVNDLKNHGVRMQTEPGKAERKRHKRKYAEGELEAERMFWFRGPAGKLNLRVQNLNTFLQLAEGIDDETWLYHLKRGDYSNWFAHAIKDKDLASEIEQIEQSSSLSPAETRARVAKAIESRYTVPA